MEIKFFHVTTCGAVSKELSNVVECKCDEEEIYNITEITD